MGRPTDNPRNVSVKFLADDEAFEKLKENSGKPQISRVEVIRGGIHKVHDDLDKKWKEAALPYEDERHFPQASRCPKTHAA